MERDRAKKNRSPRFVGIWISNATDNWNAGAQGIWPCNSGCVIAEVDCFEPQENPCVGSEPRPRTTDDAECYPFSLITLFLFLHVQRVTTGCEMITGGGCIPSRVTDCSFGSASYLSYADEPLISTATLLTLEKSWCGMLMSSVSCPRDCRAKTIAQRMRSDGLTIFNTREVWRVPPLGG